MTPEKATRLLKKQSAEVKEAVAVLLESVSPEALRYFGPALLGWMADEVRGKHPRGVPTQAVAEYQIPR